MRRQQRTLEAGPEPASVVADERKAEERGWHCGWKQAVNTKQRRPGRQRYEGWRGRGGELEEGRSGNLASMALTGGVHPWHCSCVSERERCMRENKSREGGEEDREEEQRSWRPAMGMLLLEAARRWSSCSWTTGGSGHEQGLCLDTNHSIHRDAQAAARKIRDLFGGCGWWGWIPRGRMRAVAARMGLG